jgi:threonine aldolase
MRGDVHSVQPSSVSISQATEIGTVYQLSEIATIGAICKEAGLALHMDGARFANALVSLGCSPAEMTWKAGVDILSFGGTKNGALGAEAVVFFDRKMADTFAYRHKRAGQLSSKMRFVSAQFDALLTDDLWLRHAAGANEQANRLALGLSQLPGVEVIDMPQANILFCKMPMALIDGLLAQGFSFYHDRWEPGVVRLVTSFATLKGDVDDLLAVAGSIVTAGR